jgi:hypothetical protein
VDAYLGHEVRREECFAGTVLNFVRSGGLFALVFENKQERETRMNTGEYHSMQIVLNC